MIRGVTRSRLVATALGVIGDELLGEPRLDPHPVAAFGTVMRGLERAVYRDDRRAGVLHAVVGMGVGWSAGTVLGSATLSSYLSVAGRALRQAAESVASPLRAGDIEQARRVLPSLVGRDASELGAKEIARAVVESVAENTVDALVAPVLWALAGGGPGALAYRAVNTMDAMVGHHNTRYEHYGWASARLDDLANLIPARITAGLVACVRPRRARSVLTAVRTQAGAHPSPNSGVVEAAFAAALDLRLGGTNSYQGRIEVRPSLGFGHPPEPDDIDAAIRLSRDIGRALVASMFTAAALRRSP